ncbi:MAG: RAD55 family ATPase [Candidatus Jordarchaeum sp.]|uniref:RAD55 family ATPase n=1 Tax=Candidatus Jordarchaeum sp. TaxID=2823881 RepID=UPI00404B366D
MIYKHKTEISEFDSWIGEGMPSGNYLVLGPPKVGKTIFVNQIAYMSALKKPVVYITLDGSPANIKLRMKEFNWNVETIEKENLFQFVDGFTFWYTYPQKSGDEFSVESLTNISKLLSVIVSANDKVGSGGIIVLYSLSTLLEHAGFQKSYSFMTGLKAIIEERNCLGFTVLTSGMHQEMEINAFKHICDGIIEMQFQPKNDKMTRKVRVIGLGARLNLLDWKEFSIMPNGINLAP